MGGYITHSEEDRNQILKLLGIQNVEELFNFIPRKVLKTKIELGENLSEKQIKDKLTNIANLNKPVSEFSTFLGGGAYNHYIPSVVGYVTSISQFYTAYTPYQAEISQGTLQYIFEFQSLMCRLTGMDISNASMYDGGSSLAEAILLAKRVNNKKKVLMPRTVNPQFRQIAATYIAGTDMEIVEIDYKDGIADIDCLSKNIDRDTSSVVLQNPNFFGCFEDVYRIKELLDSYPDCLYIICANPLSLALIKPPSEYGADIAVGDAQCFGNPLSFGGPYLGYFTAR
ncbi:MAG: aminomethyl-transferring glycine dehydrogenase subunit GcvPA, partial [Actinobacteria bacterium]|nr:aminomethyl-transferring glycine dehydrogenase subunit GcvPA [Actinomycetota bacterium]